MKFVLILTQLQRQRAAAWAAPSFSCVHAHSSKSPVVKSLVFQQDLANLAAQHQLVVPGGGVVRVHPPAGQRPKRHEAASVGQLHSVPHIPQHRLFVLFRRAVRLPDALSAELCRPVQQGVALPLDDDVGGVVRAARTIKMGARPAAFAVEVRSPPLYRLEHIRWPLGWIWVPGVHERAVVNGMPHRERKNYVDVELRDQLRSQHMQIGDSLVEDRGVEALSLDGARPIMSCPLQSAQFGPFEGVGNKPLQNAVVAAVSNVGRIEECDVEVVVADHAATHCADHGPPERHHLQLPGRPLGDDLLVNDVFQDCNQPRCQRNYGARICICVPKDRWRPQTIACHGSERSGADGIRRGTIGAEPDALYCDRYDDSNQDHAR